MRVYKVLFGIVAILITTVVFADGPPPPPASGGAPGVPIDGGLGILLAGGVAYGIKKVLDSRKND